MIFFRSIESRPTVSNLLDGDFSIPESLTSTNPKPSSALLDLNWTSSSENSSDFLGGDFMPSKLLQEGSFSFLDQAVIKEYPDNKSGQKHDISKENKDKVSWLSLFAELDPLANPIFESSGSGDTA